MQNTLFISILLTFSALYWLWPLNSAAATLVTFMCVVVAGVIAAAWKRLSNKEKSDE